MDGELLDAEKKVLELTDEPITIDMFRRYLQVQKGGRFNMLSVEAQNLCMIENDNTYIVLITNYSEIKHLFEKFIN